LDEAIWSLTSPRVKRISGFGNFRSRVLDSDLSIGRPAPVVRRHRPTLLVLAVITLAGVMIARRIWPANDTDVLPHQHPELQSEHPHVQGEPSRHAHAYVIDDLHPRWP
jgi:hypothetical protein